MTFAISGLLLHRCYRRHYPALRLMQRVETLHQWYLDGMLKCSLIETLTSCQWIHENRTLLIPGPSGVGWTHLAFALRVCAVELGLGVVVYRLEDLLTALKRDAGVRTRRPRSKTSLSTSILIIDEVCFAPVARREASQFSAW